MWSWIKAAKTKIEYAKYVLTSDYKESPRRLICACFLISNPAICYPLVEYHFMEGGGAFAKVF